MLRIQNPYKLVDMYEDSLHRSVMFTNVHPAYSGNFFIPENFSVPLGFRIKLKDRPPLTFSFLHFHFERTAHACVNNAAQSTLPSNLSEM